MPNELVLRIDPKPGTDLIIQAKEPGANRTRSVDLSLIFAEELGEAPEPYERLLCDAMRGDSDAVRARGRCRGDVADRAAADRQSAAGAAVQGRIVGSGGCGQTLCRTTELA